MGERSDESELRRLDVLFIDPAIVDEVLHAMQGNSSSVSIRFQLPGAASVSALERKPSLTATHDDDDGGNAAVAAAAADGNTETVFHATQADSHPNAEGDIVPSERREAAKRARLSLAPPVPVEAVTFQTRQRQQRSSLDAVLRRASIYWLTGRAPRLSYNSGGGGGGGGGGGASSVRVEINVSRTHAQLKPIASPSHMLRLRYIGNGQVQWSLVQRHLFQSRAMPPSFARFAERHDAMRPQAATRTAKQKDRERKKQVAMAAAAAAAAAKVAALKKKSGEQKSAAVAAAAAAAADPAKKKTKRPAVPKTQQLLSELSQNAASYEVAINRIGAADETFVYATPRPTDAYVRERGVCLVLSTADFFEQCREMAVLGNGRFVCAADSNFVWLSARSASGQIAFRLEKAPDPPPPVDSHPNARARQRAKGVAAAVKSSDAASEEDESSDWGYERESEDEEEEEEENGGDRDSGDERDGGKSDGVVGDGERGGAATTARGSASRKRKGPSQSRREPKRARAPQKPSARRGSRSAAAQAAEDEPRVVRLPRPGAPPVGHWFALQHVFFAISHLSATKIKSLRLYLVPDVGLLLHMRSPGAARGTGVDYYANFLPTAPPAVDLGRRPSVRRLLLTAADERLPQDEGKDQGGGGGGEEDRNGDDDGDGDERRPNAGDGIRSRLARKGGDGDESDGDRDSGGGGGSRPRCDVDSVYAHLGLWSSRDFSFSSSSSSPSSLSLSPSPPPSSIATSVSDGATPNRSEIAHTSMAPDTSSSRPLVSPSSSSSASPFRVPLSVLMAAAATSSSSPLAPPLDPTVSPVEAPRSTSLAASLFPVNERAWVPLSSLPAARRR